jgi:transcription elongation factor Elf1
MENKDVNHHECPRCKKENTSQCHSWVDFPKAYIRMYCTNCGKKYTHEYELIWKLMTIN